MWPISKGCRLRIFTHSIKKKLNGLIGRHGQTQFFSSLLKSNDKNGHMPVLLDQINQKMRQDNQNRRHVENLD